MTTTLVARYHQITAQHAYEARIRAFGLPALLAPYTRPAVVIPAQRRRVLRTEVLAAALSELERTEART